MSARERVPRRGVSGRTHRSAPTRCGKRSGDNGNWHGKRTFPLRGGTEPAPYRGAEQNGCGGVWSPRPTGATQVVPSNGPMWASAPTPCGGRHAGGVVPYGWLRRAAAIALGSGAQRSVCASGCEGWVGIAAEITPKVPSNFEQSLSHGEAVPAPVVPKAWPPSIKFRNGIWTSVTVPKILCSHTLTEF